MTETQHMAVVAIDNTTVRAVLLILIGEMNATGVISPKTRCTGEIRTEADVFPGQAVGIHTVITETLALAVPPCIPIYPGHDLSADEEDYDHFLFWKNGNRNSRSRRARNEHNDEERDRTSKRRSTMFHGNGD